jgi:LmbE family N-acetylglucosaminyl deacetylase
MLRKIANQLRARLTPSGPYRFLIRNWSGMDDIELVSGMLGTETFRRILHSQPVPISAAKSIMVLAPHQDDELIGAGGLCIKARKLGAKCAILFLTDGAETGLGRQHGQHMPPEDVVKVRAIEAQAVCQHLGAEYLELGIDNIGLATNIDHVDRLAKIVCERQPDVLLVPWLMDGAPKHRMANHLLWLASRRHSLNGFEVWGYQVNNSPLANGILDITDEIDEKIELLKLYVSQNELLRRYDYQAWGLSAWNARFLPSKNLDPHAHFAELFCMLPLKEHLELVGRFYMKDFERTYLGHTRVTASMLALHHKVISA